MAAMMVVVMMWRIGIGVELERTTKMECENESENEHFCKMGGGTSILKKCSFSLLFSC